MTRSVSILASMMRYCLTFTPINEQRTCSAPHCDLQDSSNRPAYTSEAFMSKRTEELPPGTAPTLTVTLVLGWVGAEPEALALTEMELELEEVVVGEGEEVDVGCCEVVGGGGGGVYWGSVEVVGGGGGGGEVEGEEEEPPASHEPYRTPTERSAKNSKRPCEKSRPPGGQPGHCCGDDIICTIHKDRVSQLYIPRP